MSDKEPTAFQLEIMQFQNEIAAIEEQMSKTTFADPDFDPETWLQERGL